MDASLRGRDGSASPSGTLDATGPVPAWAVAVGDAVVLALLVAWGVFRHGGVDALADVGSLVETVGPFVLGYLAVALVIGVYATPVLDDPLWGVRTAAGAWIAGTGIGVIARTHPEVAGGVAWPFGLVLIGIGTAGLLAWRLALVGYRRWRADATR